MLAEYRAGQDGRIAQMMAYAETGNCRHGTISAYFGGRPIEGCQACDNCLGVAPAALRVVAPGRPARRAAASPQPTPWPAAGGDPATLIVQGVAQLPFPLGRTGLARALKGLPTSPVQADRFPLFGALANQSRKSIGDLAAQLVDEGLLAYFERERYRLLRLTEKGQAWLEAPRPIPKPAPSSAPVQDPTEYDQALFEELRAGRLEAARERNIACFVIFHDSVLKRIAAQRPTTVDELAAIKGIGPRKLEQYGQGILVIIASAKGHQTREKT
jgi:ATP-dependent DNA helicase RecQ